MNVSDIVKASERPWERLADEPDDAWETFKIYLNGPRPRNLMRIRQLSTHSLGWGAQKLYDWNNQYNWKARARAWDDWTFAVEQEAREDALRQHGARLAEEHLVLLSEARSLVTMELHKLLAKSEENGLDVLKPGEVEKLLKTVVHLERLVVGEATERVEDKPKVDMSKLSVEELRQYAELQRKADGSSP